MVKGRLRGRAKVRTREDGGMRLVRGLMSSSSAMVNLNKMREVRGSIPQNPLKG